MAILHVVLNSSSDAPPSAAHSDYITRHGDYAKMGAAVYVESGNMPDFAKDSPQHFWEAADAQERANGRTYTELQIALPRELSEAQRIELARAATREFLGSRFAYTLALHNPEAADKIEQPHLHLMWSERAIDDTTRVIPEERFFKRNGAKKDRKWNDQNLADELRGKWAEMMNRALENAGIDQRVDPRSLADQGKVAEALLVEPKMLRRGTPEEKEARRQEIAEIREAKAVLSKIEIAAPDLESVRQADQASQKKLEASVEQIETWEAQELSKLDRAIEALKNMARAAAAKVKEVLSPRPAEIPGAGNPQLQAAVDWFVKHGLKSPLEEPQYQKKPYLIAAYAKDLSTYVDYTKTADDKAQWLKHGQVLCDRLKEMRYQRLKEKYPDETENRLRIAAENRLQLKVPLGKSQEQSKHRSRGGRGD